MFKDVFGGDTNITLAFINSVFEYEGTPTFESVDLIDRELDPIEEDGKESRLDLLGREAKTGSKVNLEVQVVKQEYFAKRSLYYWARLYDDLKRGQEYDELTRTVTINILDFILFEDESEKNNWHSSFGVYDKRTGKQLTEDLEMHFIELPKWSIKKDVEKMNSLERWTSYFDKKTSKEEMEAIAMQEQMIQEAVSRENIFTQDEIKRRRYDLIEKAERDKRGQIAYAIKQGREQGISQGREQMETLCKYLVSDGKAQEIPQILLNKDLTEQMLKKYNLA